HSIISSVLLESMRSLLLLSLLLPLAWMATVIKRQANVSENVLPDDETAWRNEAVKKLWEERRHMGHTPLIRMDQMLGVPTVDVFIKNETASVSGTLKHRFVWALMLWAVVEGKIKSNSSVYDSTSGNTGASEAYMCRLIGVNYTAVVAKNLEEEKIKQITIFGGQIMKVDVEKRNTIAEEMAANHSGFFINQFGNADAAEEFHESGDFQSESTNVFHEIASQLKERNFTYPHYFVHSAGTGGTISSVGKYITRYNLPTKVILADSQFSLFYEYVLHNKYSDNDTVRPDWVIPGIAGIGYGYNHAPIIFKNTTSLLRTVIDQVARMPDMASMAAMRSLRDRGIDAGASTALNFLVALYKGILHEEGKGDVIPKPERLSLVIIMGDPGAFYKSTYLNDTWCEEKLARFGGMKALNCWKDKIDLAIEKGNNFMKNDIECNI
ncbi:hypothetical protein PENTCL1PPCAC_17511, partial [Pristionchus entomophagus]